MLYSLAKPLLFALDPELAHDISLELLQQFHRILPKVRISKPTEVMGLKFANPIGLAAGLDKNADYLDGLDRLGFGFIEVGSVTPKPQPGNPLPRIFRLRRQRSLINRMGFNNLGVEHMLERVSKRRCDCILGINIGKNLTTPIADAVSDYGFCLKKLYPHADYIAINISSPNTPGLRELQREAALDRLLAGINQLRQQLADQYQIYRPLALKMSPDLDPQAVPVIADLLCKHAIDALIATNTTVSRVGVENHPLANENGGLSGQALRDRSKQLLIDFYQVLGEDIPIISVGGIDSIEEAKARFELGAKLIQVYTGLIYRGPGLIKSIGSAL